MKSRIDRQKMKKMYEEGYSPSVIAKEFGVSRQYVRQCVVSFGCLPDCQKKKMTACALRKEEIYNDFLAGASISELLQKYSITKTYLNRLLRLSPKTKKEYNRRKDLKCLQGNTSKSEKRLELEERDKKILALRKEGKSVSELADMFSTCESNIYRICKKLVIPEMEEGGSQIV